MTIHEFNWNFTTEWIRDDGIKMLFYPITGENKGILITETIDGIKYYSVYELRESGGMLYIKWDVREFSFHSIVKEIFQLSFNGTVCYIFKRADISR